MSGAGSADESYMSYSTVVIAASSQRKAWGEDIDGNVDNILAVKELEGHRV
jgi:hypothetical protein